MTQRSGGGFFEGVELRQELGGILIEGANTAFAAEAEESVAVESIDGVVEFVIGNKADLERVGGDEGFGLGFFLGGFGDEGLENRLVLLFFLRLEVGEREGEERKEK